jgi:hypothetical protein
MSENTTMGGEDMQRTTTVLAALQKARTAASVALLATAAKAGRRAAKPRPVRRQP